MAIFTIKGHEVLIDDEDLERVSNLSWKIHDARKNMLYFSHTIHEENGKSRTLFFHRFILMAEKHLQVDHINGDVLDNRKMNLRKCTSSQNGKNKAKSKANRSGFKGVSWNKLCKKWEADIKVDGKKIYLGVFSDPKDASEKYMEASRKYHGAFSRANP